MIVFLCGRPCPMERFSGRQEATEARHNPLSFYVCMLLREELGKFHIICLPSTCHGRKCLQEHFSNLRLLVHSDVQSVQKTQR